MKIFIDCECKILQKSLELFLEDDKSSEKMCDFIITDALKRYEKPTFLIAQNGDLSVPFSSEKLFEQLNKFEEKYKFQSDSLSIKEEKISMLCDEFKDRLMQILRDNQ